jgi:phosphohistidine phosphatase SixA
LFTDVASREMSAGCSAACTRRKHHGDFGLIAKDDHDNMALQFPMYDALYAYCRSTTSADGGVINAMWLVSLLVVLAFARGVPAAEATQAVWEALRAPGSVVILRHSFAPGGFDPPDARLDDCSTQRNLDDNGRAQAKRIGEVFREQRIAVGAVLSSPRCRCLDTGRLAFGSAQAWEPLQGALNSSARRERQLAEIKQRIGGHREGAPLVLVTHGSVVSDLTGLNVRMGELVVLRRAADGTHVSAGQLYID